jgi:hypothetical protein
VQVTGKAGVPSSGVASVFVNVMALDVAADTSLTVWPDGTSMPTAVSVVAKKTERVTHMVEVPVGTGGRIRVRNGAGKTNVVLDVFGYVLTPSASGASTNGLVTTVAPLSLADTRVGQGVPKAKLGQGRSLDLTVAGKGGVPTTGVRAVFVNVTAFNASLTTGVTVYPPGPLPATQNLSAAAGTSRSNRVLVPLGAGGKIRVTNQYGTVDLKVDLAGWVADGSDPELVADSLNTQVARRVLDTKTGTGAAKARVAKGADVTVTVAGVGGVPAVSSTTPPRAVLAFVRLTTTDGYASVSARAAGTTAGSIADVAGRVGQTMGNLVLVPLSADGKVSIRNSPGSKGPVDVSMDIVGWLGGSVITDPDLITLTPTQAATYTPTSATDLRLPAAVTPPAVGKILAAAPTAANPKGLLRRVTAVSTNPDGTRKITTRPASIAEAVRSGRVTGQMDNTAAPTTTRPGISTPGAAADRQTQAIGASSAVSRTFTATPASGVAVTGTAAAGFGAELDLDIGWRGIKASAIATANQSLNGSVTATAAAAWSGELDLGEYAFGTYVFFIGSIPVVVQPQIELTARAQGQAQGTFQLGFHQGASGRIGFEYDHGLDTINEFSSTAPTIDGPTLNAKASATVGLDIDFELEFYGTGELEVGLTGHIDAASDDCDINITGGIDARLGIELDIIGPNLEESISTPLAAWNLAKLPIPGLCGVWTGLMSLNGAITSTQPTVTWIDEYHKSWQWRDLRPDALQNVTITSNDTTTTSYSPGIGCNGTRRIFGTNSGPSGPNRLNYVGTPPPPGAVPGWHSTTLIPSISGATQTTTTAGCGDNTLTGISHATFDFASEMQTRTTALPYTDPHVIDGTVTLTAAQICELVPSSCMTRALSGSITLAVRVTDKPDFDFDGIPNSADPSPSVINRL